MNLISDYYTIQCHPPTSPTYFINKNTFMHRNLFIQRIIFSFTMVMLLIMPTSCFRHYYKIAKPPTAATPESVNSLKNDNRYFNLRSGQYAWHMKDITLSGDQKTLKCVLEDLPYEHQLHLKEGERHGNMEYKKNERTRAVLSEVHFYIPQDVKANDGNYTLSLDQVQKI